MKLTLKVTNCILSQMHESLKVYHQFQKDTLHRRFLVNKSLKNIINEKSKYCFTRKNLDFPPLIFPPDNWSFKSDLGILPLVRLCVVSDFVCNLCKFLDQSSRKKTRRESAIQCIIFLKNASFFLQFPETSFSIDFENVE